LVALPDIEDPTLAAIDRALEAVSRRKPPRPYLGMSAIGYSCERALWYSFRWVSPPNFDALSLKRFEDGHSGEDVQAARLRMVEGLTLLTIDPDTGRQYEFIDHNGHFRGHFDGAVLGLLQAPRKFHVWEHKQVSEKGQRELETAKRTVGEQNALLKWNPAYYAQAVLYMDYAGIDRHYLTVSSPGGRHTVSCRTHANPDAAAALKDKARRIIYSDWAPPRISDNPSWYQCAMCEHHGVCHQGAQAPRSCRTCLHSRPADNGLWHCERWNQTLDRARQEAGCEKHLYLPSLVPGQQVDAGEDWIEYQMNDGIVWRDGVE
jgi:hypothetical protein